MSRKQMTIRVSASVVVDGRLRATEPPKYSEPTDCVNARHSLGCRRRGRATRGRDACTHTSTPQPILNKRRANLAPMDVGVRVTIMRERWRYCVQRHDADGASSVVKSRNACVFSEADAMVIVPWSLVQWQTRRMRSAISFKFNKGDSVSFSFISF